MMRARWLLVSLLVIAAGCTTPPIAAPNSVRPSDPTAGAFYDVIFRYVHYPTGAVVAKQEGIVTLAVRVGRSGEIEDIKIRKSSGHVMLDNEALRAAERVIASGERIPWPKEMLAGDRDHFTLIFRLEFSLDQR